MCTVHLPLYKHNKRNVIQLLALYLWFNIIPFLTVLFISRKHDSFINMITCNNGTEWSPIRPVIIRVIIKIVRGRPIAIAIAERIGRHKILLLINHSHNKICNILSFLKNTGYSESFLREVKIKSHVIART